MSDELLARDVCAALLRVAEFRDTLEASESFERELEGAAHLRHVLYDAIETYQHALEVLLEGRVGAAVAMRASLGDLLEPGS